MTRHKQLEDVKYHCCDQLNSNVLNYVFFGCRSLCDSHFLQYPDFREQCCLNFNKMLGILYSLQADYYDLPFMLGYIEATMEAVDVITVTPKLWHF